MENDRREIAQDRLFFFAREEIVVDFAAAGLILDIGGGGEGVIGQLKGGQVIAIDPSKRELEEAAPGPLKIVMNAAELQFLDATFQTATSFYTLMYIKEAELKRVFDEVHRVLSPGGRFLVWDAVIPPPGEETKEVAVFQLTVKLPGKTMNVGYGVRWPKQGRSAAYYAGLAEGAGFAIVSRQEAGRRLFLELRKRS